MPGKKTLRDRKVEAKSISPSRAPLIGDNHAGAELRIFRQSYLDSSEAIMITDAQGVILDVNPAFEGLYGFSCAEVAGHTPRILRHDSVGPEVFNEMWDVVSDPERGYWRGEIVNRRQDGSPIPVLLSVTPIRDSSGRTTHFMALAIDISEKRKLEAKVQQLRREYGAFLRHEMRNRLAAVTGYLELAANHAGPVPERMGKYQQSAQDALMSTVRIIDALRELEYYELGQIELEKQEVSLRDLVSGSCAHLQPLAEQNGISIEVQMDTELDWVALDVPKMESVFCNLIKNAVEHLIGFSGEVVKVRIYKERNRPCVAVHNRGEAIPPDRLATFFERFNTTKKDKGGTGLGTTYVELITRAHGGDVRVASNIKDGTTVTVLLPPDAVVKSLQREAVPS